MLSLRTGGTEGEGTSPHPSPANQERITRRSISPRGNEAMRPRRSSFTWVLRAAVPASLLFTAGVVAILSTELDREGRLAFFAFAGATILWCTTSMNSAFVGLSALVFLVLTGGAKESALFEALAADVIWLLIGAFVIATAVRGSGFADRLAYGLLRRARTVRGAFVLLTTALLPLAFLIPSTSGRAAMFLPVHESAAERIRDPRTRRAFALLVPSIVLTSTSAALIAAGSHLIANDLLIQNGSRAFTFAEWAIFGGPFGVFSSYLTCAVIGWLLLDRRRRAAPFALSRAVRPGPLRRKELLVLLVSLGIVALWMTSSLHGLGTATVTVAGALVLCMPGVEAVKWKDGLKSISWNLVIFMGTALVLGRILLDSGVARWLVEGVFQVSEVGGTSSEILLVTSIALIALTAHLYMPSHSTRAAVLIPPLLVFVAPLEIDARAIVFIASMGFNYCLTLPVSSKALQVYEDSEVGGYQAGDLLRVGSVLLPLHLALLVAFYFGFWKWAGLALGA